MICVGKFSTVHFVLQAVQCAGRFVKIFQILSVIKSYRYLPKNGIKFLQIEKKIVLRWLMVYD